MSRICEAPVESRGMTFVTRREDSPETRLPQKQRD